MSDNEMSRDGESPDALSRVPPTDVDPETLEKLKQQVRKVCKQFMIRVGQFSKTKKTQEMKIIECF